MKEIFSVASLLFSLTFSTLYLMQIFKGKTKPQRFSWLLWTMLSATYFVSALQTNGSVLFTLGELIGPGLIFLFSLKYGAGGKSRFDQVSLAVALIAFVLLFIIDNALFGLVLALIVDGIGFMLTVRKLAKDRSSETKLPWLLMILAGISAILSLHIYSVENLLFPIYIIVSCGTFFLMAKPNAKSKTKVIEKL